MHHTLSYTHTLTLTQFTVSFWYIMRKKKKFALILTFFISRNDGIFQICKWIIIIFGIIFCMWKKKLRQFQGSQKFAICNFYAILKENDNKEENIVNWYKINCKWKWKKECFGYRIKEEVERKELLRFDVKVYKVIWLQNEVNARIVWRANENEVSDWMKWTILKSVIPMFIQHQFHSFRRNELHSNRTSSEFFIFNCCDHYHLIHFNIFYRNDDPNWLITWYRVASNETVYLSLEREKKRPQIWSSINTKSVAKIGNIN